MKIPVFEVGGDQHVQTLRIDDAVAVMTGTFDPGGLALVLDLLGQILPVTVDTEAVATLHGESLHSRGVVAADFAGEAVDSLYPRLPRLVLT